VQVVRGWQPWCGNDRCVGISGGMLMGGARGVDRADALRGMGAHGIRRR